MFFRARAQSRHTKQDAVETVVHTLDEAQAGSGFFLVPKPHSWSNAPFISKIVLSQVGDIEAEFFMVNTGHAISGQSDPAIYGHKCASGAITVAAMNWAEGDGLGGAFEGRLLAPLF